MHTADRNLKAKKTPFYIIRRGGNRLKEKIDEQTKNYYLLTSSPASAVSAAAAAAARANSILRLITRNLKVFRKN